MRIGLLTTIDSAMLGYSIRALIQEGIPVDAVIVDSRCMSEKDMKIYMERTGGRLPALPLWEFESLKIPFFFVENHNSSKTIELVRGLALDVLVNAGTPRILQAGILRASQAGVVNCHPGLLPAFRGCTCVEWAIYLNEQVGNTVHFMSEGIDEGPIVLQEGLWFGKKASYVDVRTKIYEHSYRLMALAMKKIMNEGLSFCNLPAQPAGRYFGVIDEEKMKVVLERLAQGEYAYQR